MENEAEMQEIFTALSLEHQTYLFVRAKWFHMNQEGASGHGDSADQDDGLTGPALEKQSHCKSDL